MSAARRLRVLLAAASLAVAPPAARAAQDAAARVAHVVLISIDGLRPVVYRDPQALGLRVPNLVALRDAGTSAERMIPVFPSVTYPAHTTLVTGTRPAEHGIESNFETGLRWYRDASAIRSPTLWDAAQAAGLATAIVTWPVTYGAKVAWLIPEDLTFGAVDRRALVREGSTPGLFDALEARCGPTLIPEFDAPDSAEKTDRMSACFASELIRGQRPALVLVHLLDPDHQEHAHGPDSPEARAAFERSDARVGELRRAVRDAGIADRTVFAIVGDHGFAPVHTAINVNALLLAAGFATLREGRIELAPDLRVSAIGGSASLGLREGGGAERAAQLEAALRREIDRRWRGLVELLPAAELEALGAFPGAALGLVAGEGYMLIAVEAPAAQVPSAAFHLAGMHGYRPELPSMATGFIVSGPGIRRGAVLPFVRQLDVAPTLARLLRVPLESALGQPITAAFAAPAPGAQPK